MACIHIPNGVVCVADATGETWIGSTHYLWEFSNFLGPTFYRRRRKSETAPFPVVGDLLVTYPRRKVWAAFNEWLAARGSDPAPPLDGGEGMR